MPRVRIKKYDYATKDFCCWLRGEMARNGIRQRDLATELGVTQQSFSGKIRNGTFTLKDLLVIFGQIRPEAEQLGKLLIK